MPPLLRARGEVFGLRLLGPFPALLLGVVVPSAASSASALRDVCSTLQTAWLVDFGGNWDAVNSQGGVCKLLARQISSRERTIPAILGVPASEEPWPGLSLLHSSEMSPGVEEQSLPAQTHCSWQCWGSLPHSLSIFFLHHGCGVGDGADDAIPTL